MRKCNNCGKDEILAFKDNTHGLNFPLKAWICTSCKYKKFAHTKEELDDWEKDFSIEIRKDKVDKPSKYVFQTLIDTDKREEGEDSCDCDGNCGDSCACAKDKINTSNGGCGGCSGCK